MRLKDEVILKVSNCIKPAIQKERAKKKMGPIYNFFLEILHPQIHRQIFSLFQIPCLLVGQHSLVLVSTLASQKHPDAPREICPTDRTHSWLTLSKYCCKNWTLTSLYILVAVNPIVTACASRAVFHQSTPQAALHSRYSEQLEEPL